LQEIETYRALRVLLERTLAYSRLVSNLMANGEVNLKLNPDAQQT